jgi:competence ComEA-like helix-hairpin-helix protein
VDLYTRRQLTLLLIVVLVVGAGVGIDRWRRTHPELAERLEALDRAPAPAPPPTPSRPARPARPFAHAAAPARSAAAVHVAPPLDLNRASQDDLERLPGIGPGLAARIVDSRARRGTFDSVDDLRRVRGIGDTTLARLRPLLAIGPAPP